MPPRGLAALTKSMPHCSPGPKGAGLPCPKHTLAIFGRTQAQGQALLAVHSSACDRPPVPHCTRKQAAAERQPVTVPPPVPASVGTSLHAYPMEAEHTVPRLTSSVTQGVAGGDVCQLDVLHRLAS